MKYKIPTIEINITCVSLLVKEENQMRVSKTSASTTAAVKRETSMTSVKCDK